MSVRFRPCSPIFNPVNAEAVHVRKDAVYKFMGISRRSGVMSPESNKQFLIFVASFLGFLFLMGVTNGFTKLPWH
jgi:hypothetical protein